MTSEDIHPINQGLEEKSFMATKINSIKDQSWAGSTRRGYEAALESMEPVALVPCLSGELMCT